MPHAVEEEATLPPSTVKRLFPYCRYDHTAQVIHRFGADNHRFAVIPRCPPPRVRQTHHLNERGSSGNQGGSASAEGMKDAHRNEFAGAWVRL